MRAQDIMSANPACCTPNETVQDVARIMREHDCGCVPVVDSLDSRRLVGVVTDRDLAVRGLAEGKGAETRVSEVMTSNPFAAGPDADLREIQQAMADRQLRRVPIVDADGSCVGIIAQADLARMAGERVSEREVAVVVERISEPTPGAGTNRPDGNLGDSHQRM
jgi:CBS domain-containing protein